MKWGKKAFRLDACVDRTQMPLTDQVYCSSLHVRTLFLVTMYYDYPDLNYFGPGMSNYRQWNGTLYWGTNTFNFIVYNYIYVYIYIYSDKRYRLCIYSGNQFVHIPNWVTQWFDSLLCDSRSEKSVR